MTESHVREAQRTGRIRFMGLELLVEPGVLVPRAETELLASTAIATLREIDSAELRTIDMCCGVGNIACAIAHELPSARAWAADISARCVELAQVNGASCGVGQRVSAHHGNLFEAISKLDLEGTIDAVVCNPPYISDQALATRRADLLALEPREAFAAGPYGLSIHMRVIRDAAAFLRPLGWLLMEVGLGQAKQVQTLLERNGGYCDIAPVANAAGEHRVVTARRRAENK